MELLREIEAIYELPDGTVFVDCWGPGLLINPEDFGGVEILPREIHTGSAGPWLGSNGDDRYRVFCLRDNCLINYFALPPGADLSKAEKMPSLAPKANVIYLHQFRPKIQPERTEQPQEGVSLPA